LGAQYALLRPEFLQWRERSLARRKSPVFHKILITLGGVDRHNVTGQLLEALAGVSLPRTFNITVIMGANAPHLPSVLARAKTMPYPTCVKVGVDNMAERITASDLVISAAGSTAWEVACLGVPLVLLKLAENQTEIMKALLAAQAVWAWEATQLKQEVQVLEKFSPPLLKERSSALSKCVDGQGVQRVLSDINQIRDLCTRGAREKKELKLE
jgi:spore coat polysaccharide biosynthesis predicted glycosyltransferase SpsG